MKKITLETIYSALTDYGFADEAVLMEIQNELNKGKARKDANTKAYDALHDVIVGNLGDSPCTCAELWDAIKDEATALGATKGKVQYALTHLWEDEIVKIEGTPNTYKRA